MSKKNIRSFLETVTKGTKDSFVDVSKLHNAFKKAGAKASQANEPRKIRYEFNGATYDLPIEKRNDSAKNIRNNEFLIAFTQVLLDNLNAPPEPYPSAPTRSPAL